MIKAIFAINKKGVMGDSKAPNGLPWKCPADMKRFKELTTGHIIVMGYNTWKLIDEKVLPNRDNWVVSFGYNQRLNPNLILVHSVENAIIGYKEHEPRNKQMDLWIIGGPKTILEALPHIQEMYVSVIEDFSDGDCLMPGGLYKDFKLVEQSRDEGVRFYKYERVA
jgi:dihydrofolate reductase